jgi:hypothetical protein
MDARRGSVAERPLDRFLADLQAAATRNDRAAIAGMVHYPLKVLASGWIIPVDDRATFIRSFDAFFTDEIRDLIADAAERPRPAKLPDVVSLGNGNIRLMRFDGRFKIIGIMVPPPSGKVRGARRGTTVVSLAGGQGTASFSGTLASGEHERYVVRLSRNALLEVRVDGVRGRVVARVLDAGARTPIDARGLTARVGRKSPCGRRPPRRGGAPRRRRRRAHLPAHGQRTVGAGDWVLGAGLALVVQAFRPAGHNGGP